MVIGYFLNWFFSIFFHFFSTAFSHYTFSDIIRENSIRNNVIRNFQVSIFASGTLIPWWRGILLYYIVYPNNMIHRCCCSCTYCRPSYIIATNGPFDLGGRCSAAAADCGNYTNISYTLWYYVFICTLYDDCRWRNAYSLFKLITRTCWARSFLKYYFFTRSRRRRIFLFSYHWFASL